MKRRTLNSKGPGFSKAFQDAARTVTCAKCGRPLFDDPFGDAVGPQMCEPSCTQLAADMAAVRAAAPVCDRSADVGSTHYWPDGAAVGDWCLCGKRKKFLPSG